MDRKELCREEEKVVEEEEEEGEDEEEEEEKPPWKIRQESRVAFLPAVLLSVTEGRTGGRTDEHVYGRTDERTDSH